MARVFYTTEEGGEFKFRITGLGHEQLRQLIESTPTINNQVAIKYSSILPPFHTIITKEGMRWDVINRRWESADPALVEHLKQRLRGQRG